MRPLALIQPLLVERIKDPSRSSDGGHPRRRKVARLVPQERVQQRIDEQVVEVPTPQLMEDVVEEFKLVPQGQCSERICVRIVEVFAPQVDVQESTNARLKRSSFRCRAMSCEIQGGSPARKSDWTKTPIAGAESRYPGPGVRFRSTTRKRRR